MKYQQHWLILKDKTGKIIDKAPVHFAPSSTYLIVKECSESDKLEYENKIVGRLQIKTKNEN